MIDARGLACPMPVVLAKKELAKSDSFVIMVDNETAKQNVTRFGQNNGCTVTCREVDEDYELTLERK